MFGRENPTWCHPIVAYKYSSKTENILRAHKTWIARGARMKIDLKTSKKIIDPIGRFQWHVQDDNCGMNEYAYLTMSKCILGEEYTCDSGHCIDWEKRCDNVKDCEDNSDEKNCTLIMIPTSYRKIDPPTPKDITDHSAYIYTMVMLLIR